VLPPTTYLLIDGENLDATLGNSILGRRPAPEERPRWDRVVSFARTRWGQDVKALFFINASSGDLPMPFLQALNAMELRPVLLRGPKDVKVVDVGIQRTLDALVDRPGDVLLGSHDGDFLDHIRSLLGGGRRVGLLGFRELINAGFRELTDDGLELFDLEGDAGAFNIPLPRMRVIDIDDFDPLAFL
jgi:uncharacterized protein